MSGCTIRVSSLIAVALLLGCQPVRPAPERSSELPEFIQALVARAKADSLVSAPDSVVIYRQREETVYYIPPRCCQMSGMVVTEEGSILCRHHPGRTADRRGNCSPIFRDGTRTGTVDIDLSDDRVSPRAVRNSIYRPDTSSLKETAGRHLAFVFLSSSTCAGNYDHELDVAIREAKSALAEHTRAEGLGFSAIGVAADWRVETGIRYLVNGEWESGRHDFGPWDEISAGRKWWNTEYEMFGRRGCGGVPAVYLIERLLSGRGDSHEERVVDLFCGPREIAEWVRQGARVSSFSRRR